MRTRWVRWATCALAVSICIPVALADGGSRSKKSVASCTTFDQEDKGDDKVQFTIHNSCTVPLDCSISWRVVCAPDSKKRRAVYPTSLKLALGEHSNQSAEASAAMCGDDSWAIDSVRWSCQPNND